MVHLHYIENWTEGSPSSNADPYHVVLPLHKSHWSRHDCTWFWLERKGVYIFDISHQIYNIRCIKSAYSRIPHSSVELWQSFTNILYPHHSLTTTVKGNLVSCDWVQLQTIKLALRLAANSNWCTLLLNRQGGRSWVRVPQQRPNCEIMATALKRVVKRTSVTASSADGKSVLVF